MNHPKVHSKQTKVNAVKHIVMVHFSEAITTTADHLVEHTKVHNKVNIEHTKVNTENILKCTFKKQ